MWKCTLSMRERNWCLVANCACHCRGHNGPTSFSGFTFIHYSVYKSIILTSPHHACTGYMVVYKHNHVDIDRCLLATTIIAPKRSCIQLSLMLLQFSWPVNFIMYSVFGYFFTVLPWLGYFSMRLTFSKKIF